MTWPPRIWRERNTSYTRPGGRIKPMWTWTWLGRATRRHSVCGHLTGDCWCCHGQVNPWSGKVERPSRVRDL